MRRQLLNLFFPKTCPICDKVIAKNHFLCDHCVQDIKIIEEPKCQKCGRPLLREDTLFCKDCNRVERFFDRAVSVFEHKGKLRESVYRFKYDNARIYGEYYGFMAAKLYGRQIKEWNIDAVIPVPIFREKELKRGYNQAKVFGLYLTKEINIPLRDDIVKRVKNTVPQKELDRSMRFVNLKDAFAVNREALKGMNNVLLVDDIFTTGSTLDACARILKKAGVQKVYGLCISAGVDENFC